MPASMLAIRTDHYRRSHITMGMRSPGIPLILPDGTAHLVGTVPVAGKPAKFSASDVTEINAGNLHIWLYGYLTYKDRLSRFLGSETMGYCFRYVPESDPALGMFAPCGSDAYVYTR